MDFAELEALKDKVNERYDQSPGGDLDGMLADMRSSLANSGFFSEPRLRKTGNRLHLVEAHCKVSSPNITPIMVRSELERMWLEELRYDDFEAHALGRTPTSVVLDFLTVARSARLYVTGLIIVDLK